MHKKLKIALVVSHPIQHFCPQYVSFAKNEKIDFKVFFGSALGYIKYTDKNFGKEISWGNLNLDQFDHVFMNGEKAIPSDKNLDASTLESELQAYKPDLIVIYGYFQKMQRRAHCWAIKNNIKLAYISDSELRHKRNRLKELVKYFYIQNYFRGIRYFLSVGNANEDFYRHYGVSTNRFIRMHFPIDVIQYQKSFAGKDLLRKKIRSQYGIGENEIVLAVVGKLISWKNQDHIMDAMQILEAEGINANLFILGSGQMLEVWQQKALSLRKSKVFFPGFVNIEDLPAYYAGADIYVHPASVEPHSIAVSEAVYMGCPVVISDTCGSYGHDDDVQEGKNGYTYPFGDMQQLAQKIRLLADDISMRKKFAEHSHQIAVQFQQQAHQLVLDELISKASSG